MATGPEQAQALPGGAALDPEVAAVLARLRCLAGRTYTVAELGGGLTNRNYRVTVTGDDQPGDYVVRISANESGLLAIDRVNERLNTWRAWQAGVGAPVVEALPEENVMVVGFLPGRTLTAADVRDPAVLPRLAAAVRTLHQGPEFAGGFDMRSIRRRYLDIVVEHGFRLPEDYLDLTGRVEALERAMEPGAETLVPCNNDLLAANFIDDGEKIWLIDYEYSGMNEPSFELGNVASESDLDRAGTQALVTAYWGAPAPDKLARARAWSLLARYGWTLWAAIQDGVSPIDFDFWSWGMAKYDSARAELLGGAYDEIVAGLSGAGEG